MLRLEVPHRDQMVAHCVRALPLEGCGLLIGEPATGVVRDVVGTENVAASSLRYVVSPQALLAVDRRAEELGLEVIGAFHSHTHTDAWPSATDVEAAVDPGWHWVVISLRQDEPVLRSFEIRGGEITEETVTLVSGGIPQPSMR